jgi:tetratricopeptide (TPR) repeat protein
MRVGLVCCGIAVWLTTTAAAVAQPVANPPKSDAKTDQARELHLKGAALFAQGQYERAEAAFLAAWALKKHYQIAANLGDCELKLGKYRSAAEHLAFFLREQPPSGSREDRKRGQASFDEVRAKVAAVTVRVNVDGAEVRLDGEVLGVAPLAAEVFVEPGKRTLEATRKGYEDARAMIEAKAGGALEVALRLEPPAAAVAPPVPPPPPPVARPIWPVAVGAGVAVVSLGVGIGFTVAANSSTADVATLLEQVGGRSGCTGAPTGNLAETCAALHSAVAGHDHFSKAAMASFIVGGALALGTAGVGVWTWKSKPSVTAQAAPVMGTHHGGVMVTGTW